MTHLIHPCTAPISQEFGDDFAWQGKTQFYRQHYGLAGHNGIDYAAQPGMEVRAAAGGTVLYAGWGDGWDSTVGGGAYVVILDHGDILTAYLHLTAYSNRQLAGQRVNQGDVIATTGNTGVGTGPHLHFQVMPKPFNRNNNWGCVDPRAYMTTITAASLLEEDDMPYLDWPEKDREQLVKDIWGYDQQGKTPQAWHFQKNVGAVTAAAVWAFKLKSYTGKLYSAAGFLINNNTNGWKVPGIERLLKTVASRTGVTKTDLDAAVEQIDANTEAAMADAVIDVDLTINGKDVAK